jgi:transposase
MINREMYHWIHFYDRNEKLTPSQIGVKLKISESTVRRHLAESEYTGRKERHSQSVLDDYKDYIKNLLSSHPYSSEQVFRRISENGYTGSYSTVKRYVRLVRPVMAKAYFSLHFAPGEAAQVDFGTCGTVPCGNMNRRLSVFVMVLCYSRYLYAEFIPCERKEHFFQCHYNGFIEFGGVPGRVIVDNCKCAVTENRRYTETVYNPSYLDFASVCGFKPDACNPASPNEKGIVENAVKYIKNNFLTGRKFGSLEEANSTLNLWRREVANVRVHSATGRAPGEMLDEESEALQALPPHPPECVAVRHCRADSRCRIWFDSNSYSVPSRYASQALTVKAKVDEVILYHNESMVARHRRSYGNKVEVTDPDHRTELRAVRRKANAQNLIRDFLNIDIIASNFLEQLELRELNTELHMRKTVVLAEKYGREAVAEAMKDMMHFEVYRSEYLENRLMSSQRKKPQEGHLHVPKAEDALNIELKQIDLSIYNREQL